MVVALTDKIAREKFAVGLSIVKKRWGERRSRPPVATNVGGSLY